VGQIIFTAVGLAWSKELFIKTHLDTARDYIYNCLFSQDDEKLKTVTKGCLEVFYYRETYCS
jgi:hypothetical protein